MGLPQVALFISFSTQTLERLWYTDSYDPAYFVDGRLTVAARLSVAFGLCGFMFLCIMVINGAFSELPEDTVEKHDRDRVHAARRVRGRARWSEDSGVGTHLDGLTLTPRMGPLSDLGAHPSPVMRGQSFPLGLDRLSESDTDSGRY